MKPEEKWTLEPEHWIVLRCAPSSTDVLAKQLQEKNIPAWSPSVVRKVRVPRSKTKRQKTIMLLPSFVFACLERYKGIDPKAVTKHRVMHVNDKQVTVSSSEVNHLRKLDDSKVKDKKYAVGTKLLIMSGAFAGLPCTVKQHKTNNVIVSIDGKTVDNLSLPAFLLAEMGAGR